MRLYAEETKQTSWLRCLQAAMIVVGVGIVWLTYVNFRPVFLSQRAAVLRDNPPLQLPEYDYAPWHGLVVQHQGRHKPLETAAIEIVRQVTGRARFEGQDPVAVILSWMFADVTQMDWENYPCLLAQHHRLRHLIYGLGADGSEQDVAELTEEQRHGKYVTPYEARRFRNTLTELQKNQPQRYEHIRRQIEREASELFARLEVYDHLHAGAALRSGDKETDLLHFVALDRVPHSPWFSIRELKLALADSRAWHEALVERARTSLELYLGPQHIQALRAFQERVRQGQIEPILAEVEDKTHKHSQALVQRYRQLRREGREEEADRLISSRIRSRESAAALDKLIEVMRQGNDAEKMAGALTEFLQQEDRRIVERFRSDLLAVVPHAYDPQAPQYHMLHLDYLDLMFPDLFREAGQWQDFPRQDAERVVARYEDLMRAYRSRSAAQFAQASADFFATLREVSMRYAVYPGDDTISDRLRLLFSGGSPGLPSEQLLALEQFFNGWHPFRIAWITMLVALAGLVVETMVSRRWLYGLALVLYGVSLVWQTVGFFCRVVLAGRPPVSTMYETVIWVAYMTGVFALVLETMYRNRVIGLAGAAVSSLGLVLADLMPLTLDPHISPLQPVLRSQFWLTVHVLTIVSSYAGGALAWGLGNISLGLIAFGAQKPELVRTLARYTYRAIQIAVLLLAAGTFLGGWWAAYSWGRFWGWDPKETWALIALICYVLPLHARYIGWVKDFGLAVAAVLCFAAIMMAWYGVNFVLGAGLHSYGFGTGGATWVYWAALLDIEWVLLCTAKYWQQQLRKAPARDVLEAAAF